MGKLQATGRQVFSCNATFMQVAFMSMGVTVAAAKQTDVRLGCAGKAIKTAKTCSGKLCPATSAEPC